MPEERTLTANLLPYISDAGIQAFRNQISEIFTSPFKVDIPTPTQSSETAQTAEDKEIAETMSSVKEAFLGIKETLSGTFGNLGDKVAGVVGGIKESIGKSFEGLKEGFSGIIETFKENPGKMITAGFAAVLMIFDIVEKVFKRLESASPFLKDIMSMFSNALNLILGPIGTAIGIELVPLLTSLYDRVMEGVRTLWKAYDEGGLKGMLAEVFNVLWDVFSPFIPQLIDILADVTTQILSGLAEAIWDALTRWWNGTWNSWFPTDENGNWDIWQSIVGFFSFSPTSPWYDAEKNNYFAEGGYVDPTPGGTWINVAEAGEREWIVPDSKVESFIAQNSSTIGGITNNYYITVEGYTDSDLADKIVGVIDQRTDMSRLRSGF